MLRHLLTHVGINPDRVKLDWVSSSEANRFAEVVRTFTEQVRALGPLETKGTA
jgi:F420-non-reducing hydrogenase iron-sulfur subunit